MDIKMATLVGVLASMIALQVAAVEVEPLPIKRCKNDVDCGGCESCNGAGVCAINPAIQCGRPIDYQPGTINSHLCSNKRCSKCSPCNPFNGRCEAKVCGRCQECDKRTGSCVREQTGGCIAETPSFCDGVSCDICTECNEISRQCEPVKCTPCLFCNKDSGVCDIDRERPCGLPPL